MSDAPVPPPTSEAIPVPPADAAPRSKPAGTGPVVWARHNLFRSKLDAVLTVVFGAIAIWLLWKALRFVFVTGRWDIIRVNLRLLLIGRYPEAHVLRLAVMIVVMAAWVGVLAGIVRARQIRSGRVAPGSQRLTRTRVFDLIDRFWLPAIVVLLLLLLSETPGPWITVALAVVAAVVGRLIGPLLGRPHLGLLGNTVLAVGIAAVPVAMYLYVVTAVGFDEWGGFMLNLFLALFSIVLCFPLGVLLALGRRSSLPLVRMVCTTYIELVRGAPLFVLLLLANSALGFFVPAGLAPSAPTRAIVVFTLFTAAYMAEIVRGGLQSVPRGQIEAAKAVGLSPIRQTGYIVLPQALRNVIPAQIGQLISLFKDTSLAGLAMGLFELLEVSSAITQQTEFRGQGLLAETLTFAALLFWIVSYTMSRESQRLEKRLGVGVR
jgi:general L-amino acid transport system permease protein